MEYWEIQTVPVDDKSMLLRLGVNGGMVKRGNPEQKPVNYISVESIGESMEKARKLGGKIVSSKQEVSNVGWIATAVDPEENHIALL
jgi:predicted enzyme related to lactoylglutathione lyase